MMVIAASFAFPKQAKPPAVALSRESDRAAIA
jgi:hypothetical protein